MTLAALVIASGFLGLLPLATPFLTGLLAHVKAPSKVKSSLMLAISGLITLLQASVVDGGAAVVSTASLTQWALNAVMATGIYTGIMKPFGIAEKLAPNSGIGFQQLTKSA